MNDKRATVPAFHDTAGVEDPRVLFSGALASREGGGAGDGARTRDILLGKQTLCQLSYSRSGGNASLAHAARLAQWPVPRRHDRQPGAAGAEDASACTGRRGHARFCVVCSDLGRRRAITSLT